MSGVVPKKELAIFRSLNEIINTIKDEENFEKITNFVERKDPIIDKNFLSGISISLKVYLNYMIMGIQTQSKRIKI